MDTHTNNITSKSSDLRPDSFADFIGQEHITHSLAVSIRAAKERNEALDHVLFSGSPGLGKTTLSRITARNMLGNFYQTSGVVLTKPGDIAAMLTRLEDNDVLFIDEIHRLNPSPEEMLYPAMEDGHIDIVIGKGPGSSIVQVKLKSFTLIGSTTRIGLLSDPLLDRFGLIFNVDFYSIKQLCQILQRGMQVLEIEIDDEAQTEIANRSRGTPRRAVRLLRRMRDYMQDAGTTTLTATHALAIFQSLHISSLGLDHMDQKYLEILGEKFRGGPVGLTTLAVAMGETQDTIEDVIEPYLIRSGFIQKTPQGRVLTRHFTPNLLDF